MYTIRKAGKSDILKLKDLYDCFVIDMNHYDPTDMSLDADVLSWINNSIDTKDASIFVAEDEGCIIGFIRVQCKERTLDNKEVCHYAKLSDLYVIPEARRTGVANLLTVTSFKWAKDLMLSEIILNVYERNIAARNLYESIGFINDDNISGGRIRMKRILLDQY